MLPLYLLLLLVRKSLANGIVTNSESKRTRNLRSIAPQDPAVTFRLIYVPTKTYVMDLYDGAVVDPAALGVSPEFNVEAVYNNNNNNTTVLFEETGATSSAPFYFCGDWYGWPNTCSQLTPSPYEKTVTVVPLEGGPVFSVRFTIITDIVHDEKPVVFRLISVPTNTHIMDLEDGALVDPQVLGVPAAFNVEVVFSNPNVAMVSFAESQTVRSKPDPFYFCGDYYGWPKTCTQLAAEDVPTLKTITVTQTLANGTLLSDVSISFSVGSSVATRQPTSAPSGRVTPSPVATPPVAFKLIYVPTNTYLMDIEDGALVDPSVFGVPALFNVQVVFKDPAINTVVFDETQKVRSKPDPFYFCGDWHGWPNTCGELFEDPSVLKTVTAMPARSDGTPVPGVSIRFTVGSYHATLPPTAPPSIEVTAAPVYIPPVAFKLIYVPSKQFIMDLYDGAVVDPVALGLAAQFNIEVVFRDPGVTSVYFEGFERLVTKPDNFFYCGDWHGWPNTCTELYPEPTNKKRVIAIPLLSDGTELPPVSVTFTVTPEPTPAPTVAPTTATSRRVSPTARPTTRHPTVQLPLSLTGKWELYENQDLAARHEACFIMAGSSNKAYLVGGRETRDVDILDPETNTWSKGTVAPQLLHHMQCVAVGEKLYFPAPWTGYYPRERTLDVMWVYNTANDTWDTLPAMKEARRRGSAAVVADGTKIWVSHGNRGGHEQYGNFATSYGWIDYYDTATGIWTYGDEAGFPDAPNPRDHAGGGLVNGRICVAAGRDGGLDRSWPAVSPTDCFDPVSKQWTEEENIPVDRSGSSYGTSCDGKLIVAGGELSLSGRVDVFDGTTWSTFENDMVNSRHGSGLAVDCVRDLIYIASGSPIGGGGKTTSMEIYTP